MIDMVKLELNDHLIELPLIQNYIKRKARKLNNAHFSENPEDYVYLSGIEDNFSYKITFQCTTNQLALTVKIHKV